MSCHQNIPSNNNTEKLDTDNPSSPPTTFKPTSLSAYTQRSRGLWQPNHPLVFIVMMSTYNHTNTLPSGGTVVPLAHCPALQVAHQALSNLARQHEAGQVTCDSKWGYSFNIAGKKKTRMSWVKDVGHVRALRVIDFDEHDCGLGGD